MTDTPHSRVMVVEREQSIGRSASLKALMFSLFLMAFFYLFTSFAHGATISGSVYSDEGVTKLATSVTVRLLVNGASAGTNATVSGNYSITATVNAGDAILVYIDDNATTYSGTTVSVSNGSNLASFNIYTNHLITRHDNAGTLTNANMFTALGSYGDATDICYSTPSPNLNVSCTGMEVFVPTGHSYSPGANVTTPNMETRGTFTASGTLTINGNLVNSGTFNGDASTININGTPTLSSGTFTSNATS